MNKIENRYIPDYLVTPGEVVGDYLEYAGFTQASLAERTGLSKKTINEIIKAKSVITAETALKFERTLGRPAHFWSNLECQYQEDKIRLADKIRLEKHLQWLDIIPIKDMAKFRWIEKFKEKTAQLETALHFFAVASPVEWEIIWIRDLQAAFRKTESSKKNIGIISAWLRKGEIIAHSQQYSQFDKQKLISSLGDLRKLTTTKDPEIFVPKLTSLCAAAGVSIVFVPALPKLGIHGATRWLGDNPVMQLSLYLKTNDQLWFTIFHELCHIIKHGRRELFVERDKNDETDQEIEANKFARDILIPPIELRCFLDSYHAPALAPIERFAKSVNIAPGIVVGRLQHDNILPMKVGNHLKIRYDWKKE
jgi:addiction module HigA family antidote